MSRRTDKKLRDLVRRLNHARHRQAQQIDILCNDIVSAHGDFLRRLHSMSFCIGFYEAIVGQDQLSVLLETTIRFIKDRLPNISAAVFLPAGDSFRIYIADDNSPIETGTGRIEEFFSRQLVNRLSRCGHICSLDEMLELGLEGDMAILGRVSAAAVPLRCAGRNLGFILLYRPVSRKLTSEELADIAAIVPGLCGAIRLCGNRQESPAPSGA